MKRIAFLMALIMLVMPLASCGEDKNTGGEAGMNAHDTEILNAAMSAYTEYIRESVGTDCMLYVRDGRFVALRSGAAVGVYDSEDAAMAALFDDPETETDEADPYISVPLTDSDWFLCRKAFRGLTYVAFGDSITYGIDGDFKHTEAGYKMAYPYPTLVGDTLGLGAVRNEAVSGASFCPCENRANMTEKILGFFGEADILSLMLSVNDFSSQSPLGDPSCTDNTTIYGSLHLICDYLKTNYPDAFIFFMTPFQYKNTHNGVYALEDVATAIKTVAAEYDIPVLDIYACGKFELEMHDGINDGLHPSQQHHIDYTAPLIAEFIVKHYP